MGGQDVSNGQVLRCGVIDVQSGSDDTNSFAIVTVRSRSNTPISGWTAVINLDRGWQSSMWYASSFSSGN